MKIHQIQNYNNQPAKPCFRAGVTDFYSDFDGTYMPYKYKHDVLCRDGCAERNNFLFNQRTEFQLYFDRFREFFRAAKGKGKDKFNFVITTGRNRPEINYYMQKIRQDGLSVVLPETLIINNGGEAYSLRRDIGDFFKTNEAEAYLAGDFVTAKRERVRKAAGGWDGDNLRKNIERILSTVTFDPNRSRNEGQLMQLTEGAFENYREFYASYSKIMNTNMSQDEIREYIQKLAEKLKQEVLVSPELKELHGSPQDIDWKIGELAEKLYKIQQNKAVVLSTPTNGYFYGGMELSRQLERMPLCPSTFVSIRDDGNLGFILNLSENLSKDDTTDDIEKAISATVRKSASADVKTRYRDTYRKYSTIKILPVVEGGKIDKVFDTRIKVQEIMSKNLNDLVIAAGDGSNDARMLNLLEYTSMRGFDEESLQAIYKLPIISIYVDNSKYNRKRPNVGVRYLDSIDSYFNSDGNIRFIHVDPNNPAKPQTLQDAVQLAIREYAKRNEEFRKNLSDDMLRLISNMDYKYPIDKEIVAKLEKSTGAQLWNPAKDLPKISEIKDSISGAAQGSIKKLSKNKIVFGSIASIALALGVGAYLMKKDEKQSVEKV